MGHDGLLRSPESRSPLQNKGQTVESEVDDGCAAQTRIQLRYWFQLNDLFAHAKLGFVNESPVEGMFYAARFYLTAKRLSIAEPATRYAKARHLRRAGTLLLGFAQG